MSGYSERLRQERKSELSAKVEEFYNHAHGKGGKFSSGGGKSSSGAGGGSSSGGHVDTGKYSGEKSHRSLEKKSKELADNIDGLSYLHAFAKSIGDHETAKWAAGERTPLLKEHNQVTARLQELGKGHKAAKFFYGK